MTLADAIRLNVDRKCDYPRSVSIPGLPSTVAPIDPTTLAHIKQSAQPPTFNGLNTNDVRLLHQFKGTDDLHRGDMIKQVYGRAKNLNELAHNVSPQDFVGSYLNKKR